MRLGIVSLNIKMGLIEAHLTILIQVNVKMDMLRERAYIGIRLMMSIINMRGIGKMVENGVLVIGIPIGIIIVVFILVMNLSKSVALESVIHMIL